MSISASVFWMSRSVFERAWGLSIMAQLPSGPVGLRIAVLFHFCLHFHISRCGIIASPSFSHFIFPSSHSDFHPFFVISSTPFEKNISSRFVYIEGDAQIAQQCSFLSGQRIREDIENSVKQQHMNEIC